MPKRKEEEEEEEKEEEEEEKEEEEEFEKNLKIPELIFTIDINNFQCIIVSTVWVSWISPPPPFSCNFGARPDKGKHVLICT